MKYLITVDGSKITQVIQGYFPEIPVGYIEVITDYTDIQLVEECVYYDNTIQYVGPKPSLFHYFDPAINQWIYEIIAAKLYQWDLVKSDRNAAISTGFSWNGYTFDSNQISQQQINGAVTLAMLNPAYSVTWTLANNTTLVLNQTDMFQVGAALGTHVQTHFGRGVALRQQIEAATTQAEVEAIVW